MGALRARTGLFCFLLMIFTISSSSLWAVKKASIIICAETGKVLHENNADAVTPPASLTKMMTLYLTFKALREKRLTFAQELPVSKRASLAAPCKLWLKPGAIITVRDAILGMVTKSANDASIAVAEELGKGSESQFTHIMTEQARRLGMSKTVFRNSHGLPEKQQSTTTARDMAVLSYRLYKDFPEYFKFFKEPKFAYNGHVHQNHNRLLGKIPGLDGIKTGFINASGFNLAASVVRDNRRIIAVVMGGESAKARDKEMVKLLDATYSNLRGEKGPSKGNNHKSIGDSPAPSQASASFRQKTKGKILKSVHQSPSKAKVLKVRAKYKDMDHLLNAVDQRKSLPQKRTKSAENTPRKKSRTTIKPVSREKISKPRKL